MLELYAEVKITLFFIIEVIHQNPLLFLLIILHSDLSTLPS